ncbi:hypothetical protein ABE132_23595, partial [Peribacillus simplex]|uniref:hypothetical protein n=1 Tax=Peribacillus simplex TaxID=1478 RepID=UPI003D27D191
MMTSQWELKVTIYNKIIQYRIQSIPFNMKRNQITTRPFKAVFYYVVKKATMYAKTAIFFHDLMKQKKDQP